MSKYICIHGHFYQPPRENPWTGRVDLQESAFPYHDWNERITEECYNPNLCVEIKREGNKSLVINNYTKMSFNFGPTLLNWLENYRPDVYSGIIESDKNAREYFSGHGPAIAQIYNHVIMPLTLTRDKITQVLWGIRDFEYRFSRSPEGIWLPEMAVDMETMDILSKLGIKFAILSERQAKRFRKIGEDGLKDTSEHKLNPMVPYLLKLPSGRTITIFFRHDAISDEIAFGGLLNNGETFAERLLSAFSQERDEILSVALDGETFGHHHKFGDIALAYCLNFLESRSDVKITVFGEYLEKYPVLYEVELIENTSWSCPHGVERWRENCGCTTREHPGFTQRWRAPLREAMEFLKSKVDRIFEEEGNKIFNNPWEARNNYIDILLEKNQKVLSRFYKRHLRRRPSEKEKIRALKLLEMEYNSMLCFTSCGWFFDDVSRIESRQVMMYALRTMEILKELTGIDLEERFVKILSKAESNFKNLENGAKVFINFVKPLAGTIQEKLKIINNKPESYISATPLEKRGCGILLHISSLPGKYGIGDFGQEAYRFVDLLKESGISYWQMLPLGEVSESYYNSPYKSISSFAGNRLFISPELLVDEGLISRADIEVLPGFSDSSVNYNFVREFKDKLLNRAYMHFKRLKKFVAPFEKFCEENKYWLDNYALFCALKEFYKGKPWNEWDKEIIEHKISVLKRVKSELFETINKEKFIQFLFFTQWNVLKKYANKNGVKIIGDIPFYVSYDSADVWSNPEYFKLDNSKKPLYVSGVPPDYFSETGQLWGDPVYNWNVLEKEKYNLWFTRLKHAMKLYDMLRLDHFRGFVAYWEIPAGNKSAKDGKWVHAPVYDFFSHLFKELSQIKIIGEDLGTITDDVREVMEQFKIPGMKVILFAFDEKFPQNLNLPHNYPENSVVYTGTHDNNTVLGWFKMEANKDEKERMNLYLNRVVSEKDVNLELIRLVLSSPSLLAIIPLQDVLGLDERARMNKPSEIKGNWVFRVTREMLDTFDFQPFAKLIKLFGR